MKIFKVYASSFSGSYSAGMFVAENSGEAIEQAKEEYRKSCLGQALKDIGEYHFSAKRVESRNLCS